MSGDRGETAHKPGVVPPTPSALSRACSRRNPAIGTSTSLPSEARFHLTRVGRLQHWLQADRQRLKRVNRLVDDALRDPTACIGKPEPPKHLLVGAWSRRITDEHRLVYLVDGDDLVIMQARFDSSDYVG